MQKEVITKNINGINRCLEVEVDNDISKVNCIEEGKVQLIITIPEDVINLDVVKFRKRKYAPIFDFFLENGIKNLKYSEIDSMINNNQHRGVKCEYEMVFYNENGVNISVDKTYSFYRNKIHAFFSKKINDVYFRFIRSDIEIMTYEELNCLSQDDAFLHPELWGRTIQAEHKVNKYGESQYKITIGEVTYTLTKESYERINSLQYLNKRKFFEDGNTLFDMTAEQSKLMAKKNLLKGEENFIKYIDWDGTIYV